MRSGSKNTLVSIYTVSETVDPSYNTPILTPVVWRSNVFCKSEARRGREVEVDGQIVAESYMRFQFDYLDVSGITEQMHIVCDGVTYDIRNIQPDLNMKDWIMVEAITRPTPTGRAVPDGYTLSTIDGAPATYEGNLIYDDGADVIYQEG